ncbi:hypothetical protein BRC62_00570 [Halobacteriales archaeon QH_10_67_13]|nr:MAG: hypothetical protein BRC62_00570 [Halobacteriales archaeon QH_10_67_13]
MATSWTRELENTSREFPMGLLAVVSVALGVVTLAYLIDHQYLIDHPYSPLVRRAEIIGVVGLSGGVTVSAYRLAKSEYAAADLWAIFGWSVAGVLGAVGVAGGIYLHQVVKHGELAELMFMFEELALIGLVAGLGFGVANRPTNLDRAAVINGDRSVRVEKGTREQHQHVRALVTTLSDDSREAERRFAVIKEIVDTTTRELPFPAIAAKLADEESVFPDDRQAVAQSLEAHHVPALVDAGFLAVNADAETIEYVGSPELAEQLSREAPE